MNQAQIIQKINDLSDLIQQSNSNTQFDINLILTIIGLFIAVSAIGGLFLIKFLVNYKVNSELDKRLLKLLEANPPIFSYSGSDKPDEKNRIYLREDISGVDQIDPETVLSVNVYFEQPSIKALQDVESKAYIELDENTKKPYLIIPIYSNWNGKVNYSILWPRSKFVKKD